MKKEYILISPVKNEKENIQKAISSIVGQSLLPVAWVIIDDNSNDGTENIIKEAIKEHLWIYLIKFKHKQLKRDKNIHYAELCNFGFKFIFQNLIKRYGTIDFIGILDGDIVLEKDYFEKLIIKFNENKKLGICSGRWYLNIKRNISINVPADRPIGGARLYRFECFLDCMPFELDYAPDVISLVKAHLHGWELRMFQEIKLIQVRPTDSVGGYMKNYFLIGYGLYYLGYHPVIVIGRFFKYLLNKKFYLAFYFISGYLQSVINKKSRIKNYNIYDYFHNKRLGELIDMYLNKGDKA